jgi:peptidyl-prolyl cis-trans isomerase B (cyclophilin B)
VGTNADKHARQKEGRSARLAEAQKEVVAASRRRRVLTIVAVVLGVAVILGGVLFLTRDDSSSTAATTTTTKDGATTTTAATPSSGKAAALPAPPPGITLTKATPCPPASGSAKRVVKFAGAPPTCIDPNATYTATFKTNKGDFTAELDPKQAPITVNNFVVLARYQFYNGVPFHRIVPGFVIQGGDGDGDPWGNNDLGYEIPDELPKSSADYKDYSLAMANSGPDTNGSQYFIVLPGGGPQLNPANYSLFGQVTKGQDVVAAIGKLGNAEQKPTEAVVVESVTITETK